MITPTPLPRRYASISEAAAYVNVAPKTIRRLIASGQLTGFHLGSRLIRVDLDQLDAIMTPIPTVGRDDS
jgi:excisionase family DNA binding protein